tara:strand:- start:604 stop:1062 length:459 start_codon:yes stop_codon:yes gene_type:complete
MMPSKGSKRKLSLQLGLLLGEVSDSPERGDDRDFADVMDAVTSMCVVDGVLVECGDDSHNTWQVLIDGDQLLPKGLGFGQMECCYLAWVGSGCKDGWRIARIFNPKSTGISVAESDDFKDLFSEVMEGSVGAESVFSVKHQLLVCLSKVGKA